MKATVQRLTRIGYVLLALLCMRSVHCGARAAAGGEKEGLMVPFVATPLISTRRPTQHPTHHPTILPRRRRRTPIPTHRPTSQRTAHPTRKPSHAPYTPTSIPTRLPTINPTLSPSFLPTIMPSFAPVIAPTQAPSSVNIPPSRSPFTTGTLSDVTETTFSPCLSKYGQRNNFKYFWHTLINRIAQRGSVSSSDILAHRDHATDD